MIFREIFDFSLLTPSFIYFSSISDVNETYKLQKDWGYSKYISIVWQLCMTSQYNALYYSGKSEGATNFTRSSRPRCWGRRSGRPRRPAGEGTGSQSTPRAPPALAWAPGRWVWAWGPRRRCYQTHSPSPWPANIKTMTFHVNITTNNNITTTKT